MRIEYIIIAVYICFLLAMGFVQRKLNKNISDFFRGGCQGTWWLVGTSAFISGISAYTFTAAAGVAFQAGWSCLIIYISNALGYFISGLIFAPWFRQLRAITVPDIIYMRFGRFTQQFYAWISVIKYSLLAGLPLYALALFCSAVFKLNIFSTIIVIGGVVAIYSTVGGKWAVMSNDFLQNLILLSTSILVTFLCLQKVGWVSGFTELVHQKGLEKEFRMFAEPGEFTGNSFTWVWAIAIFLNAAFIRNSIYAASKYFAVKDGKEARKASFLAGAIMLFGTPFFFIPPMVGRLLYEQQINAVTGITKPAEAAYAIVSMNVLPNGLLGLVLVAMFAATMSSMDTGINGTAGIIVKNIYPAIARLRGKELLSEKGQLIMGRIFTFLIGCSVTIGALFFAANKHAGIFELMLTIIALLGVPLVVPMLMCVLIRKVPWWSAVFTVCVTLIPSAMGFFSKELFGYEWSFQQKLLTNMAVGVIAFLSTMLFWKRESPEYKKQVNEFFKLMHTPVDFKKEVGKSLDSLQFKTLGGFVIALGCFVSLLMFLPNDLQGRLCIMFVAGFLLFVGLSLSYLGYRVAKKELSESNRV